MRFLLFLICLAVTTPALACLKDDECPEGQVCRYTQCVDVPEEVRAVRSAAAPVVPTWVWAASLVLFALGGGLLRKRRRRLAMLALLLLSGCGAGQRAQVKGVGASVIDCAAPLIQSQIGGLLQRVTEILRGAPPDWASQLTALESGGVPALACAVSRTVRDLGSAPVAAAAASSLPTYDPGAAERGRLYLAWRGLTVKGEAGEQRGRDAIPQ